MKDFIWFSIPGAILFLGYFINIGYFEDIDKLKELLRNPGIIGIIIVLVPLIGFLFHEIFRLYCENRGFYAGKYRPNLTYIKDELSPKNGVKLESLQEAFLVWELGLYSKRVSPSFREHDRECWNYIHSFWCAASAASIAFLISSSNFIIIYIVQKTIYINILVIMLSWFFIALVLFLKGNSTYKYLKKQEIGTILINKKYFIDILKELKYIFDKNKEETNNKHYSTNKIICTYGQLGVFIASMIFMGILLGLYFPNFFNLINWLIWIFFVITFIGAIFIYNKIKKTNV